MEDDESEDADRDQRGATLHFSVSPNANFKPMRRK